MGGKMRERYSHGCCVDRRYRERHPEAGTVRGCTPETCMQLPAAQTCQRCAFYKGCEAFGRVRSEHQRSCDYFPRRFIEIVSEREKGRDGDPLLR